MSGTNTARDHQIFYTHGSQLAAAPSTITSDPAAHRCGMFRGENSDLIGQTVADKAKNGLRNSTVGGRPPETLSWGIKRTAGSHPKERVSGGLPRAMVHTGNSQKFLDRKLSAKCSALSAAYLRWDGSLRSALFPAKVCRRQGLDIRDRSESANLRINAESSVLVFEFRKLETRVHITPDYDLDEYEVIRSAPQLLCWMLFG